MEFWEAALCLLVPLFLQLAILHMTRSRFRPLRWVVLLTPVILLAWVLLLSWGAFLLVTYAPGLRENLLAMLLWMILLFGGVYSTRFALLCAALYLLGFALAWPLWRLIRQRREGL